MKIIFLGCTKFSEALLDTLLTMNHINVAAIFTIPREFTISYSDRKVVNSNFADLSILAEKNNIPLYLVDSIEGKRLIDYEEIIISIKPDVILALGWYYMIPKRIRNIAKLGAWGIHASLLPNYAGGAPLVWAIINGEKETGVTLFVLDDGVDDGDIIEQEKILIDENDTIKEVYDKAIIASRSILLKVFDKNYKISFKTQDKNKLKIYPQRKPEDGLIDWSKSPKEIKDFIRAQTRPYPGAYTIIGDKKVIIWDADILYYQ